jgi:cytochrome c1
MRQTKEQTVYNPRKETFDEYLKRADEYLKKSKEEHKKEKEKSV